MAIKINAGPREHSADGKDGDLLIFSIKSCKINVNKKTKKCKNLVTVRQVCIFAVMIARIYVE